MRRSWLDRDTADRLLTGRVHPDDAPPGFQAVAAIVRDATAPATDAELADERRAVATAVTIVSQPASARADTGRRRMRRTSRVKVVGLIAVGTLLATGGLAAAGGLPDTAQDVVSDALARVGITLPPGSGGSDGPDATQGSAEMGATISQIATTTESTGVDKGAEISTEASGGMSQAGQHGLANEASDAAATGTDVADEKSGGASDEGTGTADSEGGEGLDIADDAREGGTANAPSPPPAP